MDSIIDSLAEVEQKHNSEIVDPVHLEDSLERMATDGDIQPAEQEGLDRLLKDALTGKTFTVGFLRRVNARLAEVYNTVHNAPIRTSASRNIAAVDDVVFARSTGEAGRVLAVIGTGSPSYQDTVKEYQKRYGWKQSIAVDNALALYKVVHADGKEELYFDTETVADPSYVRVPETSSTKEAVLVDSALLKEALNLWWNLLPESERAMQFSRHGSDLRILERLQTKLAEEREESLSEIHPMLSTAYSHVKANGLAKKAEYQPKTGEPCTCRPGIERDNCPACEGTGQKVDFKKIRERDKTADLETDGIPSAEEIAESFINGNISWVKEQIGGDLDKFMAVMDILGYGSEEGRSFQRIMRKGSSKVAEEKAPRKPVEEVQTADEARQIAVDWQAWQSEQSLSWGDVVEWESYFQQLVDKFPELADEFAENGIVGKEASKKAAEEKAPKEDDKKLAVWHLCKMVSPWGPEGMDPTGTRDFGDLESGNVLVSSEEELIRSLEARFALEGFKPVEDEPGRYETNQIERDDGMQDDNGNWIADYNIYVKWYTPTKGSLRSGKEAKKDIQRTISLYEFDELEENAKDKVRSKYHEMASLDFFVEDAEQQIQDRGFSDVKFHYDLSYSQGSGVSFEATVNPSEFVRANNLDEKFLALQDVLRLNLKSIDSHYSHENTVRVEEDFISDSQSEGMTPEQETALTKEFVAIVDKIRRDLCSKLEDEGYKELEYQSSDEYIKEDATANGLMFTSNGTPESAE